MRAHPLSGVSRAQPLGRSNGLPTPTPHRRTSVDDLLRPRVERRFRRLPRLFGNALGLAWRAAPHQLAISAALQVVAGAGLAAQLLVGRRVLADLAAVSAVVALANLARAEQQRLLSERVARYAAGRVLEVASAVELIAFERPEFSDRLQRARVNAQIRPVQVANGVLGVLGGLLAALGAAGALLVLAPALLAAVAAAYVPVWWGAARGSRLLHDFEVVQTERDRRRSYLFGLLSRREEAAEVRSFGLATHLGDHRTRLYDERIASLGQVLRRRLHLAVAGQLISSALGRSGPRGAGVAGDDRPHRCGPPGRRRPAPWRWSGRAWAAS